MNTTISVTHRGLTFVTHGNQMTVWTGAPLESGLISVAELHGTVTSEDELREAADEWITHHPEHVPQTPEQAAASTLLETTLTEAIADSMRDDELIRDRFLALKGLEVFTRFGMVAVEQAAEASGQALTAGAPFEEMLRIQREAFEVALLIGLHAGINFERRGYRLP